MVHVNQSADGLDLLHGGDEFEDFCRPPHDGRKVGMDNDNKFERIGRFTDTSNL